MNGKTNNWMISTMVLGGILIGIIAGVGMTQIPYFQSILLKGNVAEADQEKKVVKEVSPVTNADYVRGNPDAKITFIEYSDTECPFCKRFHVTMQQLLKLYPDKIRWVYRHYPIDSNQTKARRESEAVECAGAVGGQEKFWAYLDRMMEITPGNDGLPTEEIGKIADYVKLDRGAFDACLQDGRMAQRVQAQVEEAENAGADGTPYSVLITADGTRYPIKGYVDVSSLSQALKQLLE